MPFVEPKCGELRWPIALQAVTNAATSAGGMSATYSTVATVKARVKPLFGARNIAGKQTEQRVTDVFTIRYRSPATWRYILFGGRRYRVHHTMAQGARREWLEIMAEDLGDGS